MPTRFRVRKISWVSHLIDAVAVLVILWLMERLAIGIRVGW